MAASRAQNAHLPALTGVRFLAALHVVLFHYAQPLFAWAPAAVRAFLANGFAGVSFFFVLSGFILAYTYADAWSRDGWARPFWVARLSRVYPMYVVALALTGVLLATTHTHVARGRIAASGLASLALVQSWVPAWVGVWNVPGWSLSVEAALYLAFPAILPWMARRSASGLATAIAGGTVAALLVPTLYAVLDPDRLGAAVAGGDTPLLDAVKYVPALHIPQFVVGVAFGCAFARRASPNAADVGARAAAPSAGPGVRAAGARAGVAAASVGLAVVTLAALAVPYGRLFPLVHDGVLAPLFGAWIYCLACGRGALASALGAPALVFWGRASYAMYLLQHPVFIAVPTALRHAGVTSDVVSFGVSFACLLAASASALVAIEEPGRRWVRRVILGPRASAALAAPPA